MNKESRPENNGYIGIRDTTELAGVSTTTVSCVINNPEVTSEKVRKKVQKVVEGHNYTPDQPIRKIFSKTGNTTAAFAYGMENPSFISLIKELNQICLEHNHMFLTCDTGSSPELGKKYLYFCLASRRAGTTLTEGADSDIFEACRTHVPIAFLDRKTHGKLSNIHSNNRQMTQPIVDRLYNLGHRKIVLVGCRTPMGSVISRQGGYIETMAEKRLPIIQEYIYDRGPQLILQAGSQALNYFLFFPAASTAIICCDDIIALEALNATCPLRLEIPTDMSIVGFDNVIGNLHQPQITAIQWNLRDVSLELFGLVVNPPKEPVFKIIEASFTEGVACSRVETPQK